MKDIIVIIVTSYFAKFKFNFKIIFIFIIVDQDLITKLNFHIYFLNHLYFVNFYNNDLQEIYFN